MGADLDVVPLEELVEGDLFLRASTSLDTANSLRIDVHFSGLSTWMRPSL